MMLVAEIESLDLLILLSFVGANMSNDKFNEVETLKRKVKDLNRELFHTRNLAENLREENKQLGEKVKTLEFFKKADSDTVAHATGVIDEMRSQISSLKTQLAVYKEDMQKDAEALASCQKFLESAVEIESGMLRLKAMQDFIKRHFPNPVLAEGETWVLSKENRDHSFVSSHELGLDYVVNVCVDCGHQEKHPCEDDL